MDWFLYDNVLRHERVKKVRLTANSWRHNVVNKKLQYTYWPISHEIKTDNETFFENYAKNEAGRLVPDLFLKKD